MKKFIFLYSCRLLAFKFTEKYSGCRLQIFFKIGLLKIFATFTGIHLCWSLFWIKLQALQIYWKETPTQEFSSEYYEFFKNSYFYKTPPLPAPENMNSITITLEDLSNCKSIFSKKISRRVLLISNKFFKNRCLLNL